MYVNRVSHSMRRYEKFTRKEEIKVKIQHTTTTTATTTILCTINKTSERLHFLVLNSFLYVVFVSCVFRRRAEERQALTIFFYFLFFVVFSMSFLLCTGSCSLMLFSTVLLNRNDYLFHRNRCVLYKTSSCSALVFSILSSIRHEAKTIQMFFSLYSTLQQQSVNIFHVYFRWLFCFFFLQL